MAASRYSHDLMNYFNESEESEEEVIPTEPSLDDLSFLLSLSRYKRVQDILSSTPLRSRSSKYVQTEPDLSKIPPSWLFKAEKLVNELYTGINNIINVLRNSSINYAEKGSKPSFDSSHLRHFTCENGYWHSKLLKNVRKKDSSEIDLKYETCLTGDIEIGLAHLSGVALKLKKTLPFIMEDFESDSQTGRLSRGQMKRSLSLHDLACSYDAPKSDKCVCTEFSDTISDSGLSSACSPESCCDKIPAAKRVKSDMGNFLLETLDEISEDNFSPVANRNKRRNYWLGPLEINGQRSKKTEMCELGLDKPNSKYPDKFGLKVDKKTFLVKQTSTLQPKTIASCSHHSEVDEGNSNKIQRGPLRAREKQNSALLNQENYLNRVTVGARQKNFIRKNILALRNRSNFLPNATSNCH